MSPFCASGGICDAVVGHQWNFLKEKYCQVWLHLQKN